MQVDGQGEAIEVAISPPGTEAYLLTVDKLSAAAAAPVDEVGQVSATLDLNGAAVDGEAWDIVDPAQSFPRNPANLRVQGRAETALGADNSLEINAIQIDRVAMDVAGISLRGDGAATLRNRIPDGAVTLRLQGLGSFLGNAARAGFLPENQADLYRVMIDSFAQKGEREGEQVYTVAFKNGFTYVNGAPTFIPAPQLP